MDSTIMREQQKKRKHRDHSQCSLAAITSTEYYKKLLTCHGTEHGTEHVWQAQTHHFHNIKLSAARAAHLTGPHALYHTAITARAGPQSTDPAPMGPSPLMNSRQMLHELAPGTQQPGHEVLKPFVMRYTALPPAQAYCNCSAAAAQGEPSTEAPAMPRCCAGWCPARPSRPPGPGATAR